MHLHHKKTKGTLWEQFTRIGNIFPTWQGSRSHVGKNGTLWMLGPPKSQASITTLPLAGSKPFSLSEHPVPFLEHGWATPTSEVIVGLNKRLTHRKCSRAVACVVRIGAMLIALGNKSCRC